MLKLRRSRAELPSVEQPCSSSEPRCSRWRSANSQLPWPELLAGPTPGAADLRTWCRLTIGCGRRFLRHAPGTAEGESPDRPRARQRLSASTARVRSAGTGLFRSLDDDYANLLLSKVVGRRLCTTATRSNSTSDVCGRLLMRPVSRCSGCSVASSRRALEGRRPAGRRARPGRLLAPGRTPAFMLAAQECSARPEQRDAGRVGHLPQDVEVGVARVAVVQQVPPTSTTRAAGSTSSSRSS